MNTCLQDEGIYQTPLGANVTVRNCWCEYINGAECKDSDGIDCKMWRDDYGICHTVYASRWMRQNCRRTCGSCPDQS